MEFFIVLSFEFCCSARVKMYQKANISTSFLFFFQQKSDGDEFSVAIAVRLHKTLELAGDKFYMITCGKAGFQNTR